MHSARHFKIVWKIFFIPLSVFVLFFLFGVGATKATVTDAIDAFNFDTYELPAKSLMYELPWNGSSLLSNATSSYALEEDYTKPLIASSGLSYVTNMNNGFSICYWTRLKTAGSGTYRHYFIYQDNIGQEHSFQFGDVLTAQLPYTFSTTTNYKTFITDVNDINWYHYCIIDNGTNLLIYRNGELAHEATWTQTKSWNNKLTYLWNRSDNWASYIDDFIFFNKPLTLSDVLYTYINSLSGLTHTGWTITPPNSNPNTFKLHEFDRIYAKNVICQIGSVCNLWFNYAKNQIGETIKLTTNYNDLIPFFLKSDKTLGDFDILTDYFYLDTIDNPSVPTTYHYCLLVGNNPDPHDIQCDIEVKWVTPHDLRSIIWDCDCENSSSTNPWYDFADNAFQAVACGGRKVVCWAFNGSDASYNQLLNVRNQLPTNFPISLIYDIKDIASSTIATTTYGGINVPLKWWNSSTHQYQDTGIKLLSSTTLAAGLNFGNIDGGSMYDFYWTWINRGLYLLFFCYVLARLFGIINPMGTTNIFVANRRMTQDEINNQKLIYNRNLESIKTNRQQQAYYEEMTKKI